MQANQWYSDSHRSRSRNDAEVEIDAEDVENNRSLEFISCCYAEVTDTTPPSSRVTILDWYIEIYIVYWNSYRNRGNTLFGPQSSFTRSAVVLEKLPSLKIEEYPTQWARLLYISREMTHVCHIHIHIVILLHILIRTPIRIITTKSDKDTKPHLLVHHLDLLQNNPMVPIEAVSYTHLTLPTKA